MGGGGRRDLFNVLICLSSLSGPHYCPSPRANTQKHWPAGPQYWFMRWSAVAARSRGRRGRTGRRQRWPERVCARRQMLFTQSPPILQGLMALTKEAKGAGSRNLGRGSLSKKPGLWGRLRCLVHREVDQMGESVWVFLGGEKKKKSSTNYTAIAIRHHR